MSDQAKDDVGGHLSAMEGASDDPQRHAAAEGFAIVGDLLQASSLVGSDGRVIEGLTLTGGSAWRRLRLAYPLSFVNCVFLDDLDLSHSDLVSLTLHRCRWPNGGSLIARSATLSEGVRLEDVQASSIDIARARVGADVDLVSVRLHPATSAEENSATSLDLGGLCAHDVTLSKVEASGRVSMFQVEANGITLSSSVIGLSGTNEHTVDDTVWLDNSSPTEHATLWMSQVDVRNGVHIGPAVVVHGDVRFVDARIGSALRIGVSTDWAKRKLEGTSSEPGLRIAGGYLNLLRTTVGTRSEIKVETWARVGDAANESAALTTPHVLLNDAILGDLSLFGLDLGPGGGRVCLDGTTYSHLGVEEPKCLPADTLREAGGIAELALVRAYAAAAQPAPTANPGPAEAQETDDAEDPATRAEVSEVSESRSVSGAAADAGTQTHGGRRRYLYRAQPYRTLSQSLVRSGRAGDAKTVLIRMNRDARAYDGMRWWSRQWSRFSDITVRFGYAVHRTGIVLAASILLAFAVTYVGQMSDQFMAVDPSVAVEHVRLAGGATGQQGAATAAATSSSQCTPYYPCMQPLVFTLDILVPISDFHQAAYWQPKGDWQGRGSLVVLTLLAWVSTTVLVSALSSVARRDHEAQRDG